MYDEQEPMDSKPPTMNVGWLWAGVAQVRLGGEHDLNSASRLSDVLTQTLEGCAQLIVDISTAEFIDSSTIRVLVATKGRAVATDRRFNLFSRHHANREARQEAHANRVHLKDPWL